jgi:hypothetical protein
MRQGLELLEMRLCQKESPLQSGWRASTEITIQYDRALKQETRSSNAGERVIDNGTDRWRSHIS